MKTLFEELKEAEQHITNACGRCSSCADCPLCISAGSCVLTVLQHAIKEQYLHDLRAEAYGEVM